MLDQINAMSSKLNQIQGLRGLSIIGVFLSHWYAGAASSGILSMRWADALAWMNLGKYGVELFFMISGFVILRSLKRHTSMTSFGIDRIARIYPTFFALHCLVFFTGPFVHYKLFEDIGVHDWLQLFWTNVLLLPGVFAMPIAQTVSWSLSYEVLFYLVAALTYAIHARQARAMAVLFACAAGTLFASMHPRALFFLPGVLAYFAYRDGAVQVKLSNALALVAVLAFLWLWRNVRPEDGKTLMQAMSVSSVSGLGILAALACAGIFFFHVLLGNNCVAKICSHPFMVRLGDISYSFYLLHVLVMFPVKRITSALVQPRAGDFIAFLSFGILSFVVTLVLSAWSRQWLELKAGNALKKWLSVRCLTGANLHP